MPIILSRLLTLVTHFLLVLALTVPTGYFIAQLFENARFVGIFVYIPIMILFLFTVYFFYSKSKKNAAAKSLMWYKKEIEFAFFGATIGIIVSAVVFVNTSMHIPWNNHQKVNINGTDGNTYIVNVYWNELLTIPGEHQIVVYIKEHSSFFSKKFIYHSGNRLQLTKVFVQKKSQQEILFFTMKQFPKENQFNIPYLVNMNGLSKKP